MQPAQQFTDNITTSLHTYDMHTATLFHLDGHVLELGSPEYFTRTENAYERFEQVLKRAGIIGATDELIYFM